VLSFPRIWLRSEYGGLLGTAVVTARYLALKLLTRGCK
jgi:hypothetical protein